jgi:hypothetical protein
MIPTLLSISAIVLFTPVIAGILVGAAASGRIAGKVDLVYQVRIGIASTFTVALVRVILHLVLGDVPILVQQGLLFCAGLGAQISFPVLTLRMLDLFPAARGTAASAQTFVALLVTAFTLGIVSVKALPHSNGWHGPRSRTRGLRLCAGTSRAAGTDASLTGGSAAP